MIDFTKYREKDFYLTINKNNKYRKAIATKKSWLDVVKVIDSLGVKYTNEQLQFVKNKDWN